jgi:hypothetical protein
MIARLFWRHHIRRISALLDEIATPAEGTQEQPTPPKS